MHTPKSRQEVLDKIVLLCKRTHDVEGVVLVGSGSVGFPDKWADIDLSVVVNPADKTRQVWNNLTDELKEVFDVLTFGLTEYGDNNYLTVLLLNDYLEIDMGIISLDNLKATKDNWKILYQKSNKVKDKMLQTTKSRTISDPVIHTNERVSVIGHYIRTFAVAINRNMLFRATKELEDMRNIVVGLWAVHMNKVAKHYRDVDGANSDFKKKLADTFPKEIRIQEIVESFFSTVDLFFEVAISVDPMNQETRRVNDQMEKPRNSNLII